MGPRLSHILPRALVALLTPFLALLPANASVAGTSETSILGAGALTGDQLGQWFEATGRPSRLIGVSVRELARMFVEEGAAEGVRGDVAFAQAVFETGHFQFSSNFPPEGHNFAGIGGSRPMRFPDARVGVRAQIQLLRVYAAGSITGVHDLVEPRIGKAPPAGRVQTFEALAGRWAPGPDYGLKVLAVYARIWTEVGGPIAPASSPAAAPTLPTAPPTAPLVFRLTDGLKALMETLEAFAR